MKILVYMFVRKYPSRTFGVIYIDYLILIIFI